MSPSRTTSTGRDSPPSHASKIGNERWNYLSHGELESLECCSGPWRYCCSPCFTLVWIIRPGSMVFYAECLSTGLAVAAVVLRNTPVSTRSLDGAVNPTGYSIQSLLGNAAHLPGYYGMNQAIKVAGECFTILFVRDVRKEPPTINLRQSRCGRSCSASRFVAF